MTPVLLALAVWKFDFLGGGLAGGLRRGLDGGLAEV